MKKRLIYIFIFILFFILLFRISYLMFYKNGYYSTLLENKNNKIIYGMSAPRGRILDRNGKIIVDNVGVKTIIYNKLEGISESEEIEISLELANVLEVDEGTIEEKKYFYFLNNKKIINDMLSAEVKEKYNERKISRRKIKIDYR